MQERDRIEGELRIQAEAAQFRTAAAERNALSLEVQGFTKGFDEFLEKTREAETQIAKIRKLMSTPEGQGSVDNLPMVQRYQEAVEQAQKTRLTGEQRIRQETELQVRQTMARTAAEQASVAMDRERLSMAGQIVSEKEREARIQGQLAQAQAQAAREARDALRAANDNAATAGLLPYQAAVSASNRRCVTSGKGRWSRRRSGRSPISRRSGRSWSRTKARPRRQRVAWPGWIPTSRRSCKSSWMP